MGSCSSIEKHEDSSKVVTLTQYESESNFGLGISGDSSIDLVEESEDEEQGKGGG